MTLSVVPAQASPSCLNVNPCAHWKIPGGWQGPPSVYFVDQTSSRWPVKEVVETWGTSHRVWALYATSCPVYHHCVNVTEYAALDGYVGVTNWRVDKYGHFVDGSVGIALNDVYGSSTVSKLNRQVACHETGHALGLGHNTEKKSCMYASSDGTGQYPTTEDTYLLTAIYGHTD